MSNPRTEIRVQFDTLRSLGNAFISGAFAKLGGTYTYPVRVLKITNGMNADVIVSFDGVTDNDIVPAGGFVLYDFCSNMTEPAGYFVQAVGTQIWVKQASGAPTTGTVYATIVFGAASI